MEPLIEIGKRQIKLMLLPLKRRSSADISRFLRRGMGLVRTYCCFYRRSIEENQSERI